MSNDEHKIQDEFLSPEDSLKDLSWDELIAYWNLWLEQAQATNNLDKNKYSHGVFVEEPECLPYFDNFQSSTSSLVLGILRLRFFDPVAVTRISSSIRIPPGGMRRTFFAK